MHVLIYCYRFERWMGGSEYLPLSLIRDFQRRGDNVTLAVLESCDIVSVCNRYAIDVDCDRLKICVLQPHNRLSTFVNRLFRCYNDWKLQQLARVSDVCVSTVNPVDFGRPAHHFVYMLNFERAFAQWAWGGTQHLTVERFSLARLVWHKISSFIAGMFIVRVRNVSQILADARECVYPNSEWAKHKIEQYYNCTTMPVFYPPTLFEMPVVKRAKRCNTVISISRIDAQKKIDVMIMIVERARMITGVEIAMEIAGYLDDGQFAHKIRNMAASRPWIKLLGCIYGEEKFRHLQAARFALHACTDEAFGISVAEYLQSGLLPIVPKAGGAAEVVGFPELCYETVEEGAAILAKALTNRTFYDAMLVRCAKRAVFFSREAYLDRQHQMVSLIRESASK